MPWPTFRIESIGYNITDRTGFLIDRPAGNNNYLFIQFLSPVSLLLNGQTMKTHPDDCILYGPNTPQWFHSPNDQMHTHWFHFVGNDIEAFAEECGLPLNTVIKPPHGGAIGRQVQDLQQERFRMDRQWEPCLNGKLLLFFIWLGRFVTAGDAGKSRAAIPESFQRIRSRMLTNIHHSWTVKELAASAHLSESRFSVLYHRYFGRSPREDHIAARIEQAQVLLTNEALTVQQIACQLGYDSAAHFCRQFKARTGTSPKRFGKSGGV